MAIPVQTAADKAGMAIMAEATVDGVYMLQFGAIKIGMGTGSPNGEVTAPEGSLFVEKGDHELWMNTDGAKTWEIVGTQS
ncbi:MAG TPA: hypothetical protein PKK36_09940 [Kiritimatiellia bacterium]|nr:hypothetical protein [Kiritimatiellia bacterium]